MNLNVRISDVRTPGGVGTVEGVTLKKHYVCASGRPSGGTSGWNVESPGCRVTVLQEFIEHLWRTRHSPARGKPRMRRSRTRP